MDHTILVVDDEPASLRALQRSLAPHYSVIAAGSGEAGLEALDRHAVSLIVSDHRMAGMTGVEMLSRSRFSHPDAVRIVLTGYADVEALVQAINEGEVFYYLTKPWEPRDLLLAVRRGLERLEAERERRRLVRELRDACSRSQRDAEQKTRMLQTAAHELGTPLHLVANALSLIAAAPEVREGEWIGVADRGVAWLQRSLAQMHTAARLRAGDLSLAPQPLELVAALRSVLADVERACGNRRLVFRTFFRGPLEVKGDRRWLDQLWICLLSNAVRYTADGGRIVVIGVEQNGGVVVQVADTGFGMSEEQRRAAFEPFSVAAGDLMLHSSGRFEFGARGLGLGLSIARAIVDRHGGRISIESEEGRGTTVEVWLPGEF